MFLTPQISCLFSFFNCITFRRNIKKRASFIHVYSPKRKYVKIVVLFKLSFSFGVESLKKYFGFLFFTFIQFKKAEQMKMWIFLIWSLSHIVLYHPPPPKKIKSGQTEINLQVYPSLCFHISLSCRPGNDSVQVLAMLVLRPTWFKIFQIYCNNALLYFYDQWLKFLLTKL